MEYVEGEAPAGPMPLDEALRVAKQIAAALEEAHDKGIVHRDLKPANIKVKADGTVKVLDFGLAKQTTRSDDGGGENSPTVSMAATQAGVILGTAAYMSPEQARGKHVDKRADIWAFGVVLYEMVSGRRLFQGEDLTETLAAVVMKDPDLSGVPSQVQLLLKKCLEKDPKKRLRDITGASLLLENSYPPAGREGRWLPWALAALALVGLGVALVLPKRAPSHPTHLSVTLPPMSPLTAATVDNPVVALSPDGSQIVYAGIMGDTTQLYLRALDQFEVKPIPGTTGAFTPFFSPDGKSIGFVTADKLKIVPLAGGPVTALLEAYEGGTGASWGSNDQIIFSSGKTGEGLVRVAATGGKPEPVSRLDTAAGEAGHFWPDILPGGNAVIFTSTKGESLEAANVEVLSLKNGQRHVLIEGGGNARFVPPDQLVYARSGVLYAAPFDVSKLAVTGPATPVIDGVLTRSTGGAAQFSVSHNGTLVYAPGGTLFAERSLVWVDDKGTTQVLSAARRPYEDMSLSPDGRRLAMTIEGPQWNIWLLDIARGSLSRITTDQDNRDPLWTPDGKRLIYSSFRDKHWGLYWKPVDGSGPEERFLATDTQPLADTWSPDGKTLLYSTDLLFTVSVEGDRKSSLFTRSKFTPTRPAFSPDGHWLAYESAESGREEVYVQPYPGPGGQIQVSIDGGTRATWSSSGRELYYRNADKVMAVQIETSPALNASTPRVMFEGRYEEAGHDYAVAGDRFVFIKEAEQTEGQTEIRVIQNWNDELARMAARKK